jgi:hypothetical protein
MIIEVEIMTGKQREACANSTYMLDIENSKDSICFRMKAGSY